MGSLLIALQNRYRFERELGRGGMATVYLATDLQHDRLVALKVLAHDLAHTVGPERFLREIRLAARLQHPHILPVFDSGNAANQLWYAMPYVEGESLRDRLRQESPLPIDEALRLACEVARALDYAHRHGVVHRDVKPENILLEDGQAVVADFGIAKPLTAGDRHLTTAGIAIGTPEYMSPEQGAGEPVDGRSDIYALGCVLHEMLVGEPPHLGPTPQAILAKRLVDPVPSVRRLRDTIPLGVERALTKALARVPADRFASAADFADALTRESLPRDELSYHTTTSSSSRAARKRSIRLGLLATVPALAAVAWILAKPHWSPNSESVPASPANAPAQRIAVLYFDTPGDHPQLRYLADGLTEALIYELAQVNRLDVVSKNGAELVRGASLSRDSIARFLRAPTLVEGSIEQVGSRWRATVKLVDGLSGVDIQRASFEEAPADLLVLRDKLAQRTAMFLRERLGFEVRLQQQRRGTGQVEAWLALQRAERARKVADSLFYTNHRQQAADWLLRADSFAGLANERDSAWVEPTLFRAAVAYRRSRFDFDSAHAGPWIRVAERHLKEAVRRNPNHPQVLELKGTVAYWKWLLRLVGDSAAAEGLFRSAENDLTSAVTLDPSLASAWSALSHLHLQKPDVVQAKLAAERAYREDTYVQNADLVLWRLFEAAIDLQQYGEADRWCSEGRRRFPEHVRFAQCRLVHMREATTAPDLQQAWAVADSMASLAPEQLREFYRRKAQMYLAELVGRSGLRDSARRVLDRVTRLPEVGPTGELSYDAGYAHAVLGNREEALQFFTLAVRANPNIRVQLRTRKLEAALGDDPRFRQLID